jgi:hypothetical protein
MKVSLLLLTIGLMATTTAAQRHPSKGGEAASIAALEERIKSLEERVINLEGQLREGNSVDLNTTSKSYRQVKSSNGWFLVRVAKTEPYLNGYKVTFAIGNTTTARFGGFDLSVQWGTAEPPYSDKWPTWYHSLQSKDEHFPGDLFAGRWNEVEMILTPAKANELGYLRLSMKTDVVSLP